MSSIMKGLQNEETDFEVNVPGYGTMPLEMLKRHVKALANDFNDMVQSEEFIKAAYRTEQFYNALMALAKAMKAKSKELDETHSTGTTVGSAGIGGGVGLGIDKSPIEKVIEKPLGEGELPPKAGFNKKPHKVGPGNSKDDYEYKRYIPRDRKEKGEEWAIARDVRNVNSKLGKKKPKELDTGFYKNYLSNRPVREGDLEESLPTSPGGMGQSYRKFTPKSAGVAEGIDPYRLERLDPQTRRVLTRMGDHKDPGSWLSASEAYALTLGLQYKNRDPRGWEQEVQHYVDLYRQYSGRGVSEGAPELLKQEMPLVRHIEKELEQYGYEKGTPEYNEMFKHSIAMYRKFGNIDAIKKAMSEEQAPMFTPEEKIVNMNDKKSDGWRVYKAKPAGTKESSIMKGLQNEVNKHGSSKGK